MLDNIFYCIYTYQNKERGWVYMAAKLIPVGKSLVLRLVVGRDAKGKDIVKGVSFKGLKIDATEQNIYDTAREIEKILSSPLTEVEVVSKSDLIGA